jgi:hypothetical protein
LESIILKLKIQSLKAQLALSRNLCNFWSHELETEILTGEQKVAIAHRWDNARNENHGLHLAIDLLEKQQSESLLLVFPPLIPFA